MSEIIYANKGDNIKIPGIPYEDRFRFARPIIYDGVPSPEDLRTILAHGTEDTLITPWSLDVVRGFRDYVPSTFRMVTQAMDNLLVSQWFGIEEDWEPEEDRVLLQLQSELDAKSATIDAAIINSRKDYGGIINKAHLINRIYRIGRIHGHLEDRDSEFPFLFGSTFDDPETWNETLIGIKKMFMEYFLEVPLARWYALKTRTQEISQQELDERFVYVDWLKEKLGDNLAGVLLYGSAARTDDPTKYSDYDNWVRVRDVPAAQRALAGTCPVVIDGKVVELEKDGHPEGSHHIGIHLFPENDDYTCRFIRFLHDSREFLLHTQVLYGEFPFIKVRQDEVVERGVSHAYIKLKTIAGALNWAYTLPEKLMGKPALFEFIVKNTRFFFQHALNALEGPQLRTKQDLTERLAERDIVIPPYGEDPDYIRGAILDSMENVLRLQSEFLHSGREPNFDFLHDTTEYSWNHPLIDQ